MRTLFGLVGGASLLLPLAWPQRAAVCTNPLDVTIYQTLALLCVPLWQLNRSALVLARWVEDLGQWLLDGVLISGVTALTNRVSALFVVALTLAVMAGAITVFLQGLLTLRWVEFQRALPTLALAAVLLLVGGEPLRVLDSVQQIGASLLQQTVMDAVALTTAPPLPTAPQDELGTVGVSIYAAPIACGRITLAARVPPTLALNDFAARYLWAEAPDIHCADPIALPGDFRAQYLAQSDISGLDSAGRWAAIGLATQGVVRLTLGLTMSGGAIVDRGVAQLFRLALGLVFLLLLLALPLGLFVPTDTVLRQQLTALGAIMRGAWVAAVVLGIGLALLLLLAQSGNPWLLWLASQVFVVVCLWQSWQALGALGTVLGAANALAANVPGAASCAVASTATTWGATAALLAATAATGGSAALLGVLGRTGMGWMRQAGGRAGDTALGHAASGHLAQTIQQHVTAQQDDTRLAHTAQQAQAEAAWFTQTYDLDTDPVAAQAVQAAAHRAQQAQQQRRTRAMAQARQAGNFPLVDWLQRQALTPTPAASPPTPDPAADGPACPAGLPDAAWVQAVQAAAAADVQALAQQVADAQAAVRAAPDDIARAAAAAHATALLGLLTQAQQRRLQRPPFATELVAAVRPTAQPFGPGQPVTAARLDGTLFLDGVPLGTIASLPDGPYAAQTAQGSLALSGSGANLLATLPEGGVVTFTLPEAVPLPGGTPDALPAPAAANPPALPPPAVPSPTPEPTAPRGAAADGTAPERPTGTETPPAPTASAPVPPWKRGGA